MANTIQFNSDYPLISESDKLYDRATGLIPAYTQTLAKGPTQYVKGIAPKFLKRGKGSHVWDVDGNEYIDYNMGIGPISLGYGYVKVDNAIRKQLEDGITFSLVHPLEVEVAELIREVVPNAESVRFSKTGADVTSAAVRLARAYTGRDKVLCCGYHGWHDWYVSVLSRNRGIPHAVQELVNTFDYNSIDTVEKSLDDNTACVILEPVVFEAPKNNFLKKLQDICLRNKTILIFDEMWTGFRMAVGGAQEYFGIIPDLACYSKALANGMPISALTGKSEIMSLLDEEVFFFTTYGGEALSLIAALTTIQEIRNNNVPSYLVKQGEKLKKGYNEISKQLGIIDVTHCDGYPFRTIIQFEQSEGNPLHMKSLVQQELIKRGILWSGFHNMCFSHTDEDIEYTLEAYQAVLPLLKEALEKKSVEKYLKGDPVEPVFRKTSNFNIKPKIILGKNKR